jgi:hypothetical protein
VVASGGGAKFPAVPFNATIWPTGAQPTSANAEIVRVTAISTDTLTITRTQEGSSARTVVVGDNIAQTITKKVIDDLDMKVVIGPADFDKKGWTGDPQISQNLTMVAGTAYYSSAKVAVGGTISSMTIQVNTIGSGMTAAYAAIYDSGGTRLAVTDDIKAQLTGTGDKLLTFISPTASQTVGTIIYVALLVVGGTPPVIAGLFSGVAGLLIALNSGTLRNATWGGRTTLATSVDLSTIEGIVTSTNGGIMAAFG